MNKKIVIVIAVFFAIFAATMSPAFAVNPAQACNTGPGSPIDQCWNNWGGHATDGNAVNHYSSGAIYNNWDVFLEGRVNGSNCNPCWPFATGTGLNSRYNGDPVYLFKWHLNNNYSLDGGGYNVSHDDGGMYIWSTSANANQLQVYDTCSGLCSVYVNVGASNQASINRHQTYPVWLGCPIGNCQDGNAVEISGNPLDTQDYTLKGGA